MQKTKRFGKDFILVIIGQIISLFGNAVLRFALPLYLFDQTGSPTLLGLVSAGSFLPMVVLSPVGGIVADRVNKRNIMVVLDFSAAALIALFALALGRMPLVPLLMAVLLLLYGIQGAYQPAVQASIPLLAAPEQLMPANAAVNMVSSFAVEPRSAGGRAVLETTPGCVWSHSEYRMEYTGPAPVPAGRLALQRVDADGAEPYRLFLENDMGEADVDNYVAASVENPERAAYLAMLDGAPVGMFHINLGEHPGRAFLYGVGISPGRRGQGLGQELMLLALAEARAMRDGVVLDVDSGNAPAYHIYQKLGFCVTFQVDYFRAPVRAG